MLKKPKDVKKPKLKTIKKKFDDLFSLYIRARDANRCHFESYQNDPRWLLGKCGGPMCNFHIFSRVSNAVRFDEENCVCSCFGHNQSMEYRPLEFYRFFEETNGVDWVETMRNRWKGHKKISVSDYQALIAKYEKKLSIQG